MNGHQAGAAGLEPVTMLTPIAMLTPVIDFVREAYVRAGYADVARARVVITCDTDLWCEGKRTVASCALDGKTIWLSPRIARFDRARQTALVAHEYGHAVQGFYGDIVTGKDALEQDADRIAEEVMRVPLFYAPIAGRPIQTFDAHAPGAVRPRPKGLRL